MYKNQNARKGQSYPAPKHLAGGALPPTIINQVVDIQPVNRDNQTLDKWKRAIKSFESRIPRYRELYEVFAGVDLDPHVEGVWGKRVRPVTNANWVFKTEGGDEHKEVTQIIDSIGFESLLKGIMDSKAWNQSWFQPTFHTNAVTGRREMSANLLWRLNYRPHLGIFANDSATDEGVNIREDKYYRKTVMEVGELGDLGLYAKVAPYQMLKRGGVGDWAALVQVFGEPIIDAVWDGFDENQKRLLTAGLREMGASRVLTRPMGTEVNILQEAINGNGELHAKLVEICNKEISKGLLGTTETIEASQSSGYAQSKTHGEADRETTESDLTFVRRVLNSRFIPILAAAGFNVAGYTFELESDDEVLSKETNIDKMIEAFDKGIPINMEHFHEVSGWEPPKWLKEWEETQKRKLEEPTPQPSAEDGSGTDSPPAKGESPQGEGVELSWLRKNWLKLSALFTQAPTEIGATVTPTACCETLITLSAEAEPDYNAIEAAVQASNGQREFYPELWEWNIEALSEAFESGITGQELTPLLGKEGQGVVLASSFGITYGYDSPAMHTAWEMNLFKFSAMKAAYQSREVNELFRRSRSFGEFKTLVKKLYGVTNLNHLETEYNTAYQVGQAAATYNRLKAKMNTFPYWMYRTIGDERVRMSHRPLNGKILPADHKLWNLIFPPNDWNCRCFVVPRMATEVDEAKVAADVLEVEAFIESSPAWQKSLKNGFGRNPGNSFEVFTQEQMYSGEPDKALKKLEQLTAEDWRLAKIAMIQKERQELFTPATDQSVIDTFFEQHQATESMLNIRDYAFRILIMERAALQQIATTGGAYKYLNVLREVIQQADEVWAKPSLNQFTYVRYYRNEAIQVKARLNASGDLEITDWAGNLSEVERRGLVIRKP